jgi:cyclopropane fatty-acyl-phospholipid synthase-like methyltransferase
VSHSLRRHHAFTAERYRRALRCAGDLRGKQVLDYGCGDGALLSWIANRARPGTLYGFDPAPGAIEMAQRALRQHGIRASLHSATADLPRAAFDAIICADVIEHVADVDGLLDEFSLLLRPGGRVVVTTPVRLTERPLDPNHVREWFPEEFVELFDASALRVVQSEQFIPAAASELYAWRPLSLPVFKLLGNAVSTYLDRDALSWFGFRGRLYTCQAVVAELPA